MSAIQLVFGSAERGVELPEVDAFFETSRPGVHIVGELAGMGLIKNALTQGLQVAARLGPDARPRPVAGGIADLVIVGAGPAGIATAVGARAAGLSFALVEQDTVGGTVAHYPRQKLVMTETVDLPFYGTFGRARMSKEDLVAAFADVAAAAHIQVHEQTKVTGIDGEPDDFVVSTHAGSCAHAASSWPSGCVARPRQLGVPGEELPKVAYRLIDPDQYAGQRVLVVGGGDSALEAAIQLAEDGDGRGEHRLPPSRVRALPAAEQAKARRALLVGPRPRVHVDGDRGGDADAVVVDAGRVGPQAQIPNDFVIACLGGELPTEFLKSVGIGDPPPSRRRVDGEPGARRRVETERTATKLGDDARDRGCRHPVPAGGGRERVLPAAAGQAIPRSDHALLRPAGLWGHGVGMLATGFMLLNFVYPLRKRVRRFKRRGSIGPWLRFHVFVGLMSPAVILFHSAFQWGNQLATATYLSLVVVVVTGLVGRFIYGFHRIDGGDARRLAELRASFRAVPRTSARRRGV